MIPIWFIASLAVVLCAACDLAFTLPVVWPSMWQYMNQCRHNLWISISIRITSNRPAIPRRPVSLQSSGGSIIKVHYHKTQDRVYVSPLMRDRISQGHYSQIIRS